MNHEGTATRVARAPRGFGRLPHWAALGLYALAAIPATAWSGLAVQHTFAGSAGSDAARALIDVRILDDGSFVAVGDGRDGSSRVGVVRKYTSEGDLDTSFGDAGTRIVDAGSSDDAAWGVEVDSTGRIYVAGEAENGTDTDLLLARLTPEGDPDGTFVSGGIVTHDLGASETAWDIALAANGDILVAGSMNAGSTLGPGASGLLARIDDANGQLVDSFDPDGSEGYTTWRPDTASSDDTAVYTALEVQPDDGHIVVGGYQQSADTQ